jgi:hypothetical protein
MVDAEKKLKAPPDRRLTSARNKLQHAKIGLRYAQQRVDELQRELEDVEAKILEEKDE